MCADSAPRLSLQVHLTLPELPADARAMMLTMSSFGSNGFKNVKTLQVCLLSDLCDPKEISSFWHSTAGTATCCACCQQLAAVEVSTATLSGQLGT